MTNGSDILVVEDENIVAMDIQDALESADYKVVGVVSSGREAIAKALQERPDLVLMDIRLKGEMDGVQAAKQIREKLGIPIIYLTAYSDSKTLQSAKVAEPYGYLLKPFEKEGLHSAIQMALYKHRIEKELNENRQWLATILKSTSDAVAATDLHGLITFLNPVAEKLLGLSSAEATGRLWTDEISIADKGGLPPSKGLEAAFQSGLAMELSDEATLIARDGRRLPIGGGLTPALDQEGRPAGFVLTFRDITHHKSLEEGLKSANETLELRVRERTRELSQANKALQSSEARFRSIAESAADGIVVADDEGNILYANRAAEGIFGASLKDLGSKKVKELLPARHRETFRESVDQYTADPEKFQGRVMQFEGVDFHGREFPMELSVSSWKDQDRIFYAGIFRNVTDRKQLENAVLHSQRLAAMGQMAAVIAHELKAPLGVLYGFTEALLGKFIKEKERGGILKKIKQEVTRCAHLVDNLLGFARKHDTGERHPVDLKEALKTVLSLVVPHAMIKTVAVRPEVEEDALTVSGNREMLEQVMINLAVNAVDSMPKGGTLTIRLSKEKGKGAPCAKIDVEDTGPGIPPALREKLFQPFFTTKGPGVGTGLGLWLSREIINGLGGTIDFSSAEGKGTVFSVRLPLVSAKEEQNAETIPSAKGAFKRAV